jgi:nitrite reductase/ring-hydroxylating ferredoxin subunit
VRTVFNNAERVVEGWYWALPSARLRRGRIRAVTLCGRALAVYRTPSGRVVAVDAHCPHMGAHLAEGRVEGEGIRCFFHGWRWDAEGRLADVPCLERPPPAALRRWPVAEAYGLVWIWVGEAEPGTLPVPPALAGRDVVARLGGRFAKRCHPNVVLVNAIDEQHFRTVHRLPGSVLRFETKAASRAVFEVRNVGHVPTGHWLGRLAARFYRGPLTYELSYWYGTVGTTSFGPDALPIHLMFALRPGPGGTTEGRTILLTTRRRGLLGWLATRAILWLSALGGRYFARGDTRVFDTIRFDLATPILADRTVVAFIRHVEAQPLAERWREAA